MTYIEIIVYFYRWVVIVSQSIEGLDQAKEGGCWLRNQQGLHKKRMAHAKVIDLSES